MLEHAMDVLLGLHPGPGMVKGCGGVHPTTQLIMFRSKKANRGVKMFFIMIFESRNSMYKTCTSN
jgi:hypothetical protein